MKWNPADAIGIGRRIQGRMSQGELARRLTEVTGDRWTRDMVANLENGRRTFDVDLLFPVSKALGLPTEFILFGELDGAKGVYLSSLLAVA